MADPSAVGMLDTSTVILLGRIADPASLSPVKAT
jgi:hypothetical protein